MWEDRSVLVLADGCNWGEKPRSAAVMACRAILHYLGERLESIETARVAGDLLLRSFAVAHARILEGRRLWECGTTTLLAGMVLPTRSRHFPFSFVCLSVGDCKCFHYSAGSGQVRDVTRGNRQNVDNPCDPGGRLGPANEHGSPDLRNLALFSTPCECGDLLLLVTDGVHDNLDPELCGVSPDELLVVGESWDQVSYDEAQDAKEAYTQYRLGRIFSQLSAGGTITPRRITDALVHLCTQQTEKSRRFLSDPANARRPLPTDYAQFPGKMDHTTCVAFRV
jgi:Protein phosphatase 2C